MKTLRILQETDPESPREWDNLGTMACWHRRYNLGDVQPKDSPEEWLRENAPEGSEVLPLYLYDHSGITMNTSGFSCPWDSGQVGWIVATPEKIREGFMVKRITKKVRERVREVLRGEVKVYDQYLRGACWGFVCEDAEGNTTDSCFGFYGDDLEETGIADSVPDEAKGLLEDAWDRRGDTP